MLLTLSFPIISSFFFFFFFFSYLSLYPFFTATVVVPSNLNIPQNPGLTRDDEVLGGAPDMDDDRVTQMGHIEPCRFPRDRLIVVSQNVRSLQANGGELDELLDRYKYDVVSVQECWQSHYKRDHYDLFKLERSKRKGGGVAILAKEELELSQTFAEIHPELEIIIAESKKYQFINIYRPPNGRFKPFLDKLYSILECHYKKFKTVFLSGDFNVNLSLDKFESVETFDLLSRFNLLCYTECPTRVTVSSSSMIDAIFSNTKDELKSGVLLTEISDHLAPFMSIPRRHIAEPYKKNINYRNTSDKNLKNVDELLLATDWESEMVPLAAGPAGEFMVEKLEEYTNLSCPILSLTVTKATTPENPWMTAGILKSRETKLSLHKTFIKEKTVSSKAIYVRYRNLYKKVLRSSKVIYWEKFYKNNFKNSRLIWNETKKLIGKKKSKKSFPKTFTDGKNFFNGTEEISEGFNSYFTQIGKTLASKFGPSNNKFEKYLSTPHNHKFSFEEVSEAEIENYINNMESKKSSSFDKLSNAMVKKLVRGLIKPITILINKSLEESFVPANYKIARVLPLYKSGDKCCFNNYRPISLLSVLSKLLEKAAYRQMYEYFEAHFMTPNQFGFRRGHETQHCVMNFLRNIWSNADKKYHVGIFIDLKKAFDTVDHRILLSKFKYYGFDDASLAWIRDYLSDRKQAVDVEGSVSGLLDILFGVPQGSILGPLFFLIFINDLPGALKLLLSLFADDTTLQWSGNSVRELEAVINRELEAATEWFSANRLSLHPGKTQFMVFTSNRRKAPSLNLKIMGIPIKQCGELHDTKYVTFLGLILDEKLQWKGHVSKIASKLRSTIFLLNQVKNVLPLKVKINLYNALIKPHIEYCLNIYGNSPSLPIIEKLQKKAIRITFRSSYSAHAIPLLKKANTPSVRDLYKLNICTLMRKHSEGTLPENIHSMFKFHFHQNRQANFFETQKSYTALLDSLPNYLFPKIWNENFKNCDIGSTVRSFKKRFKDEIIESYSESCTAKDCYSCKGALPNRKS